MNTLSQARDLLQIHEGSCSVQADSLIGKAFALMQASGDVQITNCSTVGFINVYCPNFKPRFIRRRK